MEILKCPSVFLFMSVLFPLCETARWSWAWRLCCLIVSWTTSWSLCPDHSTLWLVFSSSYLSSCLTVFCLFIPSSSSFFLSPGRPSDQEVSASAASRAPHGDGGSGWGDPAAREPRPGPETWAGGNGHLHGGKRVAHIIVETRTVKPSRLLPAGIFTLSKNQKAVFPPQMTPKSKRKSILVRMLRPVSVAFGEPFSLKSIQVSASTDSYRTYFPNLSVRTLLKLTAVKSCVRFLSWILDY